VNGLAQGYLASEGAELGLDSGSGVSLLVSSLGSASMLLHVPGKRLHQFKSHFPPSGTGMMSVTISGLLWDQGTCLGQWLAHTKTS
jgi:hypothetical protein